MFGTSKVAAAIGLFRTASNDPEDTLFLSLTQKEVQYIGLTMLVFQMGMSDKTNQRAAAKQLGMNAEELGQMAHDLFAPTANQLVEKMVEAISAQKVPSDA